MTIAKNEARIVHIRLTVRLLDSIEKEASKRGQTISSEIRRTLYDRFLEEKPEAKQ